jgi:hypothetical protein
MRCYYYILIKIHKMKKSILILLIAGMFMPKQATAQNNDGVAAAAAGLLAIGGAIAAIEQIKENLEQVAVEQVLTAYPYLVNFELKTGSLKGTKLKDLSSVGVITFEITDRDSGEKYVLFAFTSQGWANEYGVDFSRLMWKNFTAGEWNKLMQNYIQTASGVELTVDEVAQSKIVNTGVKQGSKFILKFDKIGGDVYLTSDYSDEFKIVFNERSMGLYLKATRDLIQVRRKAIIKAHEHLNED